MRSDKLFCISYGDGGGLRDLARMRPDKLFLFFPLPARRGAKALTRRKPPETIYLHPFPPFTPNNSFFYL